MASFKLQRGTAVRAGGVLAVVAVVFAGVLALRWSRLGDEARLATAYGAHVACACHYIEGRPLADCRKDFEPGMALVTLSADESAHDVTARLFPLASDTATYREDGAREGPGCVLAGWR